MKDLIRLALFLLAIFGGSALIVFGVDQLGCDAPITSSSCECDK